MLTYFINSLAYKKIVACAVVPCVAACILFLARGTTLAVAGEKPATVRLVVDYGDGAEVHFPALAWREGMTVLDALVAAGRHPHGIPFVQRGTGASALVTQIGDQKNQGGGQQSKNWILYINKKTSDTGAGSVKLKTGDAVLWKFQEYEYNP